MYDDENDLLKNLRKTKCNNDIKQEIIDEIDNINGDISNYDHEYVDEVIKLAIKHKDPEIKKFIARNSRLTEQDQLKLTSSKIPCVIRQLMENESCSYKVIKEIQKIDTPEIKKIVKEYEKRECFEVSAVKKIQEDNSASDEGTEENASIEIYDDIESPTELCDFIRNELYVSEFNLDDFKLILEHEHFNHKVAELLYLEMTIPDEVSEYCQYISIYEYFLNHIYKNEDSYPRQLTESLEKECLIMYASRTVTKNTASLINKIKQNNIKYKNKDIEESLKLVSKNNEMISSLIGKEVVYKASGQETTVAPLQIGEYEQKLLKLSDGDIECLALDILNIAKNNSYFKINKGDESYVMIEDKNHQDWIDDYDELIYENNDLLSNIGSEHYEELLEFYKCGNYEGLDFSKSEKYLKPKIKNIIKKKIEDVKSISLSLEKEKTLSFAEKLKQTAKSAALNSAIEEANNKLVAVTASTMTNIGLPEFISNDDTFKQVLGVLIPSIVNWGIKKSEFFSEQIGKENVEKLEQMSEYALKSSSEKLMKPFIEKIVGITELKALTEPMKEILSLQENNDKK